MLKCPICNKEFDEMVENGYTAFAAHVHDCAYEAELKQKTDQMKKINEQLEELKRMKTTYEAMRDDFAKKYPDIYKANFVDKTDKNDKVVNIKTSDVNKMLDHIKVRKDPVLIKDEYFDDLISYIIGR